ncbi:MAG TPA: abscisic acid-deficient protein Aba4 family protein [Opitutales bacterium]|nr:abscisic acid-deficient protein Aba4 family protein [Opitutales bacterium]
MPVWLIEVFAAKDLDSSFILILLMTAPVWLAMIALPESRLVRSLAQPFLLPPLYCIVLFVLLWKSHQSAVLPDPYAPITYESARQFSRHPISFLALFCNLQILNLVAGTLIYQKAMRCGMRAPVELLLCWFIGAVALIPFALRLLVRKKSLA